MGKNNLSTYESVSQGFPLLRGIAILGIVSLHLFGNTKGYQSILEIFSDFFSLSIVQKIEVFLQAFCLTGEIGVHIFLFVSGFGLMTSWWNRYGKQNLSMPLFSFWERRFTKIMPPYWAATALTFFLYLLNDKWAIYGQKVWQNDTYFIASAMLSTLTTVRNFIPPFFYFLNGAWWYIGTALQLYFLFPFMIAIAQKTGWRNLLLMALGVSFIFRLLIAVLPLSGIGYTIGIHFCLARLFEFVFGMVTAIALLEAPTDSSSPLRKPSLNMFFTQIFEFQWVPLLCVFLLSGIFLSESGGNYGRLLKVPADALICIGVIPLSYQLTRILGQYMQMPFKLIGKYSYGIYLTHMNIYLIIWAPLVSVIPSYWPRFCITLLLTSLIGGLLEIAFTQLKRVPLNWI